MKDISKAIGNIAGVRKAIEASEFDAVILCSPENIKYVSDVQIDTLKSIRDRLGLIVWAKGKEPVFVLCQVEESYVRQESWITDIRGYKEFFTPPMTLVEEALRELGLEKGHIGCELEFLPGKYVLQLMAALPQLKIEPCDGLMRQVRMFKTQREIEILQHGYRGTASAMMSTYLLTQIGEDEFSLSRRLAAGILHSGADSVAFNHINAGPNTGFPHAAATDYRVTAGDIIKADSGGFYQGYYSNVGRTGKMGKPTDEEKDTWKRLREIHHHITDMLRPGNTGQMLFEEARMLHEKHKLPFPFAHHGHSIGLEVHEYPMIKPFETTSYEAGMVSTVETRVRQTGVRGLHIEDLMLITDKGPIVLSDTFDNEEILVI